MAGHSFAGEARKTRCSGRCSASDDAALSVVTSFAGTGSKLRGSVLGSFPGGSRGSWMRVRGRSRAPDLQPRSSQ